MNKKNKELAILVCTVITINLIAPLGRYVDFTYGLFSEKSEYIELQSVILESGIRYVTGGSKGSSGYKLKIKYKFIMDGRSVESTTYSFGQKKFWAKSEALAIANKFKPGDKVPVFVHRENEEISVLDLNDNSNTDFLLLLLFTMSLSIYLVFNYIKKSKKTNTRI